MGGADLFLLVTNKRDLTCDYIVRELRKRSLSFFRLNTEDLPEFGYFRKPEGETTLSTPDAEIELKQVRAGYFRRPLPPEVEKFNLSHSSSQYAREEWVYLLRSLYLEIGERWLNHPNHIQLAEDKSKQLSLAQRIGFLVPETVITNRKADVVGLFSGGDVVAKPFKHSLISGENEDEKVIYTSSVHSIDDIEENDLKVVPAIFQRKIEKSLDLRVVVVENDVFCVAIHSQEFEMTRTDWRHSSVIDLRHEVFALPHAIKDRCRALVTKLNLRYGAIDLVVDKAGEIWFLECNPNGQWAWLENRTGIPISASIVDAIVRIGS